LAPLPEESKGQNDVTATIPLLAFPRFPKLPAPAENETRYSPARVVEVIAKPVWGQPDAARICTSHVERQNLTMRMHIRRLTRLTNAFFKETAESEVGACVTLWMVQLLSSASDPLGHSGNGLGDHGSHLEHRRNARGMGKRGDTA